MTKFHTVFDTQKLFRNLLESMSYVGTVKNVYHICSGCDYDLDLFKCTQALAIMYLDADTSFHVYENKNIEDKIAMITYCRKQNCENATTIFVPFNKQSELAKVIKNAKEGSLINPHEGATIIVECNSCTSGKLYKAKGPGIETEATFKLNIDCDWLETRKEKNVEFPLGVDLIFVDGNSNLLAIPRTTQIERG